MGRRAVPLRPLGERSRRRLAVDSGLCVEPRLGRCGVTTADTQAGCRCRPIANFSAERPVVRRRIRTSATASTSASISDDTEATTAIRRWYPGYDEDRFARNWVFVNTGHLADRDSQRYWAPRGNNVSIIRTTTNITNYTVVNNYVVNRGVDPRDVQRASGHPVEHVTLQQVIKRPQFVAQANKGVQIQTAACARINPRGTGKAEQRAGAVGEGCAESFRQSAATWRSRARACLQQDDGHGGTRVQGQGCARCRWRRRHAWSR